MRLRVLDEGLYHIEITSGFRPKRIGDAGLDLRARENTMVMPGRAAVIPLGVQVEIPLQHVGWLTGRSSSQKIGLHIHEGKIDAGYRGEIHCICSAFDNAVRIDRGERLCQLVVVKIQNPEWEHVEVLSPSDRGEAGLGSTGRL